jgi:octaprenyl-diphosphate synthase
MSATTDPTAPTPQAADFSRVFAVLKPHMAALDVFLRRQLEAFEPEIRDMADYCIDTSGKRIRPALVFLSGWEGEGAIREDLVKVAAVVELVHLATLVHDDIMDEADLRRSRRTASRAYGPEAAVLLGDALFAHALYLAAVADSTRKVCAGEIIQTLRRRTTEVSREDYVRVIDLKTAELFRVSCQLGAELAGYPGEFAAAAARFGRHLGIGYQIYDDLADFFGEEKRIGKTLGTDLASGKLTLPLLVLAERLPAAERSLLEAEIKGDRRPDAAARIRQMQELGVFAAVAGEVFAEVRLAGEALGPHASLAPTAGLLRLCDVLRTQVEGLREQAVV